MDLLKEHIEENFDVGTVTKISPLEKGYANKKFFVQTTAGPCVYKIHHKPTQNALNELTIIREIASRIPVPPLYSTKQGAYLDRFNGALYQFMGGDEPLPSMEISGHIGFILGCLHTLTVCSQQRTPLDYDSVNFDASFAQPYKERKRHLEHFEVFPSGLIHGDLFPANVLFSDSKLVALLDFEEAGQGPLVYDIGMTANGFCFVDNSFVPSFFDSFIQNYERCRSLTLEERAILPQAMFAAAYDTGLWHVMKASPESIARATYFAQRLKHIETFFGLIT